jgi:peptide/nickel transport system substrate-binding protein
MGAVPEPRSHRGRRRGPGLRAAPRRLIRAGAIVCGAATLALAAAACGGGGATSAISPGGTRVTGGTATYALPPSTTPNYIFPFASSTYFSVANAEYFQNLMYRPLYWFGNGTSPTLNPGLSLASPPVYSGRQVTITMKDWKWSDGQAVTAKDVLFWVHMMQAVGATDWGAYVPGGFPTNVTNVAAPSDTQVTMTMNKDYNHTWFTSNELSQITPMPKAWDRTASGPSDCTGNVSDCPAVYTYLDSQSKNMSGYTSSHLWSVVDGPWKLQSFSPDGNSTFVPNRAYSGPVKPTIDKFQEIPFTTETAQYNVLQAHGSDGQSLDVGYLPTTDAPKKPAGATVGSNPVSGYTLDPLYLWSINYFVLNLQSASGNGPVLRQPYFRQALQYLINQKSVIEGPLRGYGLYTVGPVGSYPATSYLSPKGKQGDPFPYNPAKAKDLLTSHGWSVASGGTTCADPAKCGPGIRKGQSLSFNLPYATGTNWISSEMTQLQSNASQLGIKLNLQPKPFNQVTAIGAGNCAVAHTSCNWDMANWGGGWSFVPDYYPTGETLFMSGSGANSGGYTDAHNDSLINQTLTTNATTPLYTWQDYLSQQVPVIWQPNGVYQLTEVINNLHGVIPQSTTGAINPENWYFTK